eukprot:1361465-Amorphochlora_amoeboformis.AAC.1
MGCFRRQVLLLAAVVAAHADISSKILGNSKGRLRLLQQLLPFRQISRCSDVQRAATTTNGRQRPTLDQLPHMTRRGVGLGLGSVILTQELSGRQGKAGEGPLDQQPVVQKFTKLESGTQIADLTLGLLVTERKFETAAAYCWTMCFVEPM